MLSNSKKLNSRHPLHATWYGMIARCYHKQRQAYKWYGARGITVCDRWRNSFANFVEDMGEKPSPLHQLERIDNNKGYSPENCCWATPTKQGRNRSGNLFIEAFGYVLTMAEWAEVTGLNYNTLRSRLIRGWHPEEMLAKKPTGLFRRCTRKKIK